MSGLRVQGSITPRSIQALVNFQKDRSAQGRFSQWNRELVNLSLNPVETTIVDLRSLPRQPRLDIEGFALVDHVAPGDYRDEAFLNGSFVDSCLRLVEQLTGAKVALNMYYPIVRKRCDEPGTSDPATFIHIDQTRDSYHEQAAAVARRSGYELKRGAIYNVWKAFSPPPQDQPLAVCDRRDIDPSDLVVGMNQEKDAETSYPFLGVATPAEPLTMYYAPDMTIDESIVFLSADFDEDRPIGCAHSAITLPDVKQAIPRESVELRVLALLD